MNKMRQPELKAIRQTNANQNAIVFIHGFTGRTVDTWQRFPELVQQDPKLNGWDVFCYGYESSLFPFFGLWEGNPPLPRLAKQLQDATNIAPLTQYSGLTLVAHSMGGLIVQQALVISEELRQRVTHAFCYATPSCGLAKAKLGSFFNRQARDMRADGPFIRGLRERWKSKADSLRHLKFFAVAGDKDEFVPSDSSLTPFPEDQCRVVHGNHLEIVKPESDRDDSFLVFREAILGEVRDLPFLDAARVASERNEFGKVVATLLPQAAFLDDLHMARLVIALSELGESAQAHALLETHERTGTDFLGVWAGQLKRRWRLKGHRKDIDQAIELYRQGCAEAERNQDPAQILYHAINVAHLLEVGKNMRSASREFARKALEACAAGPTRDYWTIVTEAEAHIYLNKPDRAAELYAEAVKLEAAPRHLKTTYQQACHALPSAKARAKVLKAFGDPTRLEAPPRSTESSHPPAS